MEAWFNDGIRVDVELAVMLEFGLGALARAEGADQTARAKAFNRDIWRVAGVLAPMAPNEQDRRDLAAQAQAVAAGNFVDFAPINRRFAGIMAARAATNGAMRRMLGDWQVERRAGGKMDFGSWLVNRLETLAAKDYSPAADRDYKHAADRDYKHAA